MTLHARMHAWEGYRWCIGHQALALSHSHNIQYTKPMISHDHVGALERKILRRHQVTQYFITSTLLPFNMITKRIRSRFPLISRVPWRYDCRLAKPPQSHGKPSYLLKQHLTARRWTPYSHPANLQVHRLNTHQIDLLSPNQAQKGSESLDSLNPATLEGIQTCR